jgi:hypothetical protein
MARLTEKSIQQIVEKRRRAPAPDRSASWRMSSLLQSFHAPIQHRSEMMRYFPIAVVAVIDGYFRSRLATLIDSGEPFITNAVTKYSEIKLNLQLAGAIATRKVSLGELIMDSISISNLASLVQVLVNITGRPGCLEEIAQAKPLSIGPEKRKPIISNPKDTWSRLDSAFDLRHILCHELAADIDLNEEEMRLLLLASQDFIKASAAWIEGIERPNIDKMRRRVARERSEHHALTQNMMKKMLMETSELLFAIPFEDGAEMKAAIRQAESALATYSTALNKIRSYGIFEFERKKEELPIYEMDNRLMEPLIEELNSMFLHLQSRAKYEDREDSTAAE